MRLCSMTARSRSGVPFEQRIGKAISGKQTLRKGVRRCTRVGRRGFVFHGYSPMPEFLVVGGGLAGAAAAILLARAGRQITLLEKSSGAHHKVCGEFLSGEALHYLGLLGFGPESLGAVAIQQVRCVHRRVTTEQFLPFPAMSLTRKVLDQALLELAKQAGATVLRGVTVEGLTRSGDQWTVQASEDRCFRSGNVLLAQGKHDLRGYPRGNGRQGNLIALNAYFRLTPQQTRHLRGAVELHLFRKGYAGLQLVEGDLANLGLLITRERFRTFANGWDSLLQAFPQEAPVLAERLAEAHPTLAKPLALAAIPYGFQRETTEDGLWWLGDQAAVIPSFSGDGMSIALHSAFRVVEAVLHGGSAAEYQQRLARELWQQVRLATLVSQTMVNAPWLAMLAARVPSIVDRIARRTRVPLPGVQHVVPAR